MGAVPIDIDRKVQTRFKQAAVRAFPNEFIAFMLGKVLDDRLTITDIYIPRDQKKFAEKGCIEIQRYWYTEAMQYGADRRIIPIASVHTHVYLEGEEEFEPAQSQADLHSWEVPDLVAGIANVVKRQGKRHCRDIMWFGPSMLVEARVK